MSWLDGTNGKLAAIRIEIMRSKFQPPNFGNKKIGPFAVVYLVAKPLILSEAEGDLVVIETSIQLA